jgi:lysophospholipase L1-like esterase
MQQRPTQRGLNRKTRRIIIGVLVGIIVTFYAAAAVVRWLDPWGVGRLKTDQLNLALMFSPDADRFYKLTSGEYQFSNWSMTVNPDGSRRVTNTNLNAGCTIALLGDSVTMAWGVSDEETWASLLAEQYPDVHLVNTAVTGYDLRQIYSVYQATEADGYFYLMVSNDAEMRDSWQRPDETEPVAWQWPSLTDYLDTYLNVHYRLYASSDNFPVFDALWEQLAADDTLLAVGLTKHHLVERTGVPFIPMYRHQISYIDGHANAEGNREIANALAPYFQQLKTQVCDGGD